MAIAPAIASALVSSGVQAATGGKGGSASEPVQASAPPLAPVGAANPMQSQPTNLGFSRPEDYTRGRLDPMSLGFNQFGR